MSKAPQTLNIGDVELRMDGAVGALEDELAGLRAGRASAALLASVTVEAYGQTVPLEQVGAVNVPDPRMISVQVWDKAQVAAVEKAIREAGLGVSPVVDGQTVRVPVPALNEDRRRELGRLAGRYAEQARVAVRNIRRDAMDQLKRMEKDGHVGQDARKRQADQVQRATDARVEQIGRRLAAKEREIMQV